MPTINLKVQIKGGVRTDTEIYVEPFSLNGKSISFKDGDTVHQDILCKIIEDAIKDYLRIPVLFENPRIRR